jgi:Ni/Fe-hydrogenase subunit HybB-like protein
MVGVGIWGINIPVAWGFAIVNFVWWIGIGHAGTLISAILLLLLQKWRNSINRLSEAMTLFAVACAGMFPLLHLGRPWAFFWILPYPNTMGLWPQFRSALVWDVFAVGTYFTVSLVFWYTGLVPDLATMRDRARTRFSRIVFGFLALGWRGSAIHWKNYQTVYLILAGLSTPLVLSVHSVVSFDFSTAILPGWHTTIFPPFFVAGAVYSGFAMVLNILIPLRYVYGLQSLVTPRHLNCMANVMLTTGLMVGYGYIMETFTAWYSGDIFEQYLIINRAFGPYGPIYWALILFNIALPQLLWFRGLRTNPISLFFVALSVNVGMWLERFVIVIVSLHRDFLPSSWGIFAPTGWDWLILLGSVGLFASLIFLFVRFLPMISIFEVREIIAERQKETA